MNITETGGYSKKMLHIALGSGNHNGRMHLGHRQAAENALQGLGDLRVIAVFFDFFLKEDDVHFSSSCQTACDRTKFLFDGCIHDRFLLFFNLCILI